MSAPESMASFFQVLTLPAHPSGLRWVLAAVLGALALGSGMVRLFQPRLSESSYEELIARMRSWWVMALLFGGALLAGPKWNMGLMALVSFLALKEFLSIVPTRRSDRRTLFWAYLSIPIQWLLIVNHQYAWFVAFIPLYATLFIPFRLVISGETEGFLQSTGTITWGLLKTVYALGHVSYLILIPAQSSGGLEPVIAPDTGPGFVGVGLIFYLVLCTQANDVFQYLWGKSFGKRQIVARVSPGKTWAGFLGGLVSTALLGAALAPLLTPFSSWLGTGFGLLIAASGFVGDVVMSAVKRDLKIKDSGSMIPGHGGILDRIDSLLVSAPLFFHAVRVILV